MKTISARTAIGAIGAMGVLLLARSAGAQVTEGELRSHAMTPADHALELSIGTGYAEGFGNVGATQRSLQDLSAAGGAVQLGIGYRIVPHLSLGVYGSGSAFAHGGNVDRSTNLQSWTAGVEAGWHFLPASQMDPVVSLGTGWRAYGITTTTRGNTWQHGLELARLQVALDYRLTPEIAISPVIGADATLFLTEWAPGDTNYQPIASPNVNTFVFAGLLGRFDIPTRTSENLTAEAEASDRGVTMFQAPEPPPQATQPLVETPAQASTSGAVKVAEDILAACDMPDVDAYFAFNASRLLTQDIPDLDRLATCFTTGPLAGRSIRLVGRADPRGGTEYNIVLGQARADAVRIYMIARGLDARNVETSSRGALDATGKDETGWAYDRRVDVLLVK